MSKVLVMLNISFRYKNGEIFEIEENDARVSLTNHNMTLGFSVLKPIDSGTFECVAENRIGTERITVELEIRSKLNHETFFFH